MGSVMRRQLNFTCEGASLAATLDAASGSTGLLIVSGGNEIRSGAHRGMAWLAAEVAALGYPVFRFDRRGIGDSEGENGGFESSGPDIAAALATFRTHCPHLTRIIAFGNCDAASALLIHPSEGDPDALLLANPWTFDTPAHDQQPDDSMPPPAAIRARYAAKLRDPREWVRLLRGGVDLRKLARGLRSARAKPVPSGLVGAMRQGIARFDGRITVLLASRDATAMAFAEQWRTSFGPQADAMALESIDSGSHSFADDVSRAWLLTQIVRALRAS